MSIAAITTVHQLRRYPLIAPLSITPLLLISRRCPPAPVQSHHLSGGLWVVSGGETRWWSRQQWACRRQEINEVKNMIGAADADGFAIEEILVWTTGDGGGDKALQLTSNGAGTKRCGGGGR